MKVVAIVQARMGSTRLPNKVMRTVLGIPMIELLLTRLSHAKELDVIAVATTIAEGDTPLVEHIHKLEYSCVRGSENDVLGRFVKAGRELKANVIVRITGDCPLVDPELVDECVHRFQMADVDYFSNANPPTYPDGLDIEVFSLEALEKSDRETSEQYDREHVTPYIINSGQFSIGSMHNDENYSSFRWTVDELSDFMVIEKVFEHFHPNTKFSWNEVLLLQQRYPSIFSANRHLLRNEQISRNSGCVLWERAKQVIPGGGMLLSKRAEMHLPGQWPSYFSKTKGCRVWDLDGREYIDMSIMGVGTNILGYNHPEVDQAVHGVIDAGNLSTLNCAEEVYLAERLVELHKWADMVRLARSGGEANAVAIRIARAASGREQVAFCGYHGWHDWYLAANVDNNNNLSGHLLPGLEPNGVPTTLGDSIFPFTYNDSDELESLIQSHDIGVIKMEVARNTGPDTGFLEKVRKLATDNNIVLVFDECTSGFRQSLGGLHKIYGVDPDMAVFGKALGNGYGITAVIGKRDIMEAAQSTFISSTFWTERIGPTAALRTLDVMSRIKSWEQITQTGANITSRWKKLANSHGLSITTSGISAMPEFSFNSHNALAYKTLITQEMLAKGYLAGTGVYVCIEHTSEIVDEFFDVLDPVFALIKECEDGRDVMKHLKGPVCHSGFKRLN